MNPLLLIAAIPPKQRKMIFGVILLFIGLAIIYAIYRSGQKAKVKRLEAEEQKQLLVDMRNHTQSLEEIKGLLGIVEKLKPEVVEKTEVQAAKPIPVEEAKPEAATIPAPQASEPSNLPAKNISTLPAEDRMNFCAMKDHLLETERWRDEIPVLDLQQNWNVQPIPAIHSSVVNLRIFESGRLKEGGGVNLMFDGYGFYSAKNTPHWGIHSKYLTRSIYIPANEVKAVKSAIKETFLIINQAIKENA